jgi:Long-chain fatty acid transport protein
MKRNRLLILALCLCTFAYGQGELDAYRLSVTDLQGTARGQAMGGAFGALGGDMTSTMINPAGVGVYLSSEISGTVNLDNQRNNSNWNGTKDNESSYNFRLNNLSLVYYSPIGNDLLKSINFGFSFHQLKNFHNKYRVSSNRSSLSLTDYISNMSYGVDPDVLAGKDPYAKDVPWLTTLGWNGYIIDDFINSSGDNEYRPAILEEGETVNGSLFTEEKGYVYAYDFTLGFNFGHKLYWGATFALTDIDYTSNSYYTEDYEKGGSFTLENNFITEGSGYQLKTGLIWRPVDALRLGVSYHSPTWYHLTDYYKAWLDTDFGTPGAETPDDGRNSYRLQTPYSWTFSAARVIGTKAIISVDVELKDYTTMNLQDRDGYNYIAQNDYIDQDFKLATTFRIGAEYRFTPQFSFRLGYAGVGSPYTADLKNDNLPPALIGTIPHYIIDGGAHHFTGGLGYRITPQFYIDLAFVHRRQSNDLYFFPSLYEEANGVYKKISESKPATLEAITNRGLLTIGYKF